MTPSAKTKHYLEGQGYWVSKVERWIPQARRRIDAFGIGDFIAFKPTEKGCILVQATTHSNLSSHRRKIQDNPITKLWLQDKDRKIWIVCWKKNKIKVEEIEDGRQ